MTYRSIRWLLGRTVFSLFVWAVVLIISFPLIWMVVTSLKPSNELLVYPPQLIPSRPTLAAYFKLFNNTSFVTNFLNSLYVSCATTVLAIVTSTLGAYSITRFRFAGYRMVPRLVLFTYLLPNVVLLVPLYVIIAGFGLRNQLNGLVLAYTTFSIPFSLWLLQSFVSSIPIELEDAGRVDGAGRLGVFIDIVLPQLKPGIISAGLFTFILSWNEYLYALVFINDNAKKTLPPGVISLLAGQLDIEWDLLMAGSVTMTIPLVLLFAFFQRQLTTGFSAGAVKG